MPYTLSHIFELSQNADRLDIQALFRKRAKEGFRGFVRDLRAVTAKSRDFLMHKEAAAGQPGCKGEGWAIQKGLVIFYDGANENEFMEFLEKPEHLGGYKWFEPRSVKENAALRRNQDISPAELPYGMTGYTQTIKILGQFGKNPAMDIGFFLENDDGSLSLQHIVREMDGSRAFVGGMVENGESIRETCYIEALQEMYSKRLFAPSSSTLLAANQVTDRVKKLLEAMKEIAKSVHLAKFAEGSPYYGDIVSILCDSKLSLTKQLDSLKSYLDKLTDETKPGLKKVDLEHYLCLFKGYFYAALLPSQWASFKLFLDGRMVQMQEIVNAADGRNTSSAYMTTTPHYFFIKASELKAQEDLWLLTASGGDDAAKALKTRIEDLFDDASMFSSHGSILLQMLAHKVGHDPDYINHPARQAQLAAIERHLNRRTAATLDLVVATNPVPVSDGVPAASGMPLQAVHDARGEVLRVHLPIVSTEAKRAQLAGACAMANPAQDYSGMSAIDSLTEAEEYLNKELGAVRFARICAEMENQGINSSFRIVLAHLHMRRAVTVIIDDSGSTRQFMTVTNVDGRQITMSRWESEHMRVKGLLPFLAAAGVQVYIQFLNDRTLVSREVLLAGTPIIFDFSVKKDGCGEIMPNDGEALSAELNRATNWLKNEIFAAVPDGATDISSALNVALTRSHPVFVVTDGKPEGFSVKSSMTKSDNVENVSRIIKTRDNKAQTPILFIAATDKPLEVEWLRQLQEESAAAEAEANLFVAVLMDYATEAARLSAHGDAIPFSLATYMAMHVVIPVEAEYAKGFFAYLQALAPSKKPLLKDQLSEMMGYNLADYQYDYYLSRRAALQEAATGRLAATRSGPFTPAAVSQSVGGPPAYSAVPDHSGAATQATAPVSPRLSDGSSGGTTRADCCVM